MSVSIPYRWCVTCDELKWNQEFEPENASCNVCLGLPWPKRNENPNETQEEKQERRYKADKERHRRYYWENREQMTLRSALYSKSHQEQIRQQRYNWKTRNPLYASQYSQKRRAIVRNAAIGEVNFGHILQRDGFWCYICGCDILPEHKMDFDHVIPLDRGGSHSEENIKPTHAVCNRRKHTRLLEEMTPYQRRGV